MTARADRDLHQVITTDGKGTCVFDKNKAKEHRTEPKGGFDHSEIFTVWVTEYNNYVMSGEGGGFLQVSKAKAHSFFLHHGFHELVTDEELEKVLI